MSIRSGPTTSESPYGTMQIEGKEEKDHKNVGFTIFKVFEALSSLYCSFFIYVFFINEDFLSIIYISWPMFTIIDIVVILDRLFNFKREAHVLVFEITACLLGFISHTLCAIILMYLLNQEQNIHFDTIGNVLEPKFIRYIKPAVISTAVACLYLMDCLLSADALLDHWGIHTWSWPDFPNIQVDLDPTTPLRLVLPWETNLARESLFSKFRQYGKS